MRIVGEEIPYVKSVSLGVWINVGTRNEVNYTPGISHFIEHMLFKGTKNRTSKKISNDIDYYGGSINAFTTHDHTCFHVKLPYNHIDMGIDVLADMILNSVFDEDSIEKEKSVIIEEIRMYEDSPEEYIYESLLEKTFSNRGIGKNILGTIESVQSITRKDIIEYFSRFYLPNNAVIVANGCFKFEEISSVIENKFLNWSGILDKTKIFVEDQVFKKCLMVENRDDEQVNIGFYMQCPDDSNIKDFYAIKLLGNILGNTSSSRLFQNIREDKGLCYNIYTQDTFYVGFGEFGIYSSIARENTVEVLNLVMDEIINLKNNYITDEELSFAKEKYKGSVIMNIEDTVDRMMSVGTYEVIDERVPSFDEMIKIVDSIDLAYMKDVINRTITPDISIGVTGKNVKKIIDRKMFKRIWG